MTIFELAVMSCLTLHAPYNPLGDTTTTCSWKPKQAFVLTSRCEEEGQKMMGQIVYSDMMFAGIDPPRISNFRCTPWSIIE